MGSVDILYLVQWAPFIWHDGYREENLELCRVQRNVARLILENRKRVLQNLARIERADDNYISQKTSTRKCYTGPSIWTDFLNDLNSRSYITHYYI